MPVSSRGPRPDETILGRATGPPKELSAAWTTSYLTSCLAAAS